MHKEAFNHELSTVHLALLPNSLPTHATHTFQVQSTNGKDTHFLRDNILDFTNANLRSNRRRVCVGLIQWHGEPENRVQESVVATGRPCTTAEVTAASDVRAPKRETAEGKIIIKAASQRKRNYSCTAIIRNSSYFLMWGSRVSHESLSVRFDSHDLLKENNRFNSLSN